MRKLLLTGALAFAGVFAFAQDNKQAAVTPAASAPVQQASEQDMKNMADIKFDADTFDFGTIKQGDVVTHEYKFSNIGKEPLVITGAHGSCGCTVPEWPKEPIKKGTKASIKVTFNSAGKQGDQIKTVTINSNAKQNPKIIYIKGKVNKPEEAVPATPAPANQK